MPQGRTAREHTLGDRVAAADQPRREPGDHADRARRSAPACNSTGQRMQPLGQRDRRR